MTLTNSPETLTVLYDGACPLCRREIAHVQGLAQRRSDSALCFLDISQHTDATAAFADDRAALLAQSIQLKPLSASFNVSTYPLLPNG